MAFFARFCMKARVDIIYEKSQKEAKERAERRRLRRFCSLIYGFCGSLSLFYTCLYCTYTGLLCIARSVTKMRHTRSQTLADYIYGGCLGGYCTYVHVHRQKLGTSRFILRISVVCIGYQRKARKQNADLEEIASCWLRSR